MMFHLISNRRILSLMLMVAASCMLIPGVLFAHCDTLDGPVVLDARLALQKGDITPVLKWVQPSDENAIKEAFSKTLKVRTKGDDAKDLADMYFFETLIRIHRAGEGVAYTGIKPAGAEVDPGIEAADKAIETGSADEMMKHLGDSKESKAIQHEFDDVIEKKKAKDQSVEAGREYVAAYVKFIHHVESAMAKPGEKKDSHHEGNHQESADRHNNAGHSESTNHQSHSQHSEGAK